MDDQIRKGGEALFDESESERPYEIEKHKRICKTIDGSTANMQKARVNCKRPAISSVLSFDVLEILVKAGLTYGRRL